MSINDLVPNPLAQINAAAIKQGTGMSSAQQAAPSGPDVTDGKVTQQLQTLAQQAKASSVNPPPSGVQQGPSEEYVRMLQIAHNYHQVRQAVASQKLAEMNRGYAQGGFLPDPKQMMKLMKQSGMKVDTSPEGIRLATNYYTQYFGEKDPVTGESREMPKEISGMMEKAKAGSLNKKDITQFVLGGMVKNELRSDRYASYDQSQQAAIARRGNELILKATDDSTSREDKAEAIGNLAIMFPTTVGQMAKHWLDFSAATPEERQTQISIASGSMSPKEIADRRDKLVNDAQAWAPNAAIAQKYADAISQGKELPPDVQAAMAKPTPSNIASTASVLTMAVNMGIPAKMIPGMVSTFLSGGDISGFLPKQTPVELQQQFQKETLALDKIRTSAEAKQASAAADYYKSEIGFRKAETDRLDAQTKLLQEKGIGGDPETIKLLAETLDAFAKLPAKNQTPGLKALQGQLEQSFAQVLGGDLVKKPGWFGRTSTEFQSAAGLGQDVTGPEQQGAKPQSGDDNSPIVKLNPLGQQMEDTFGGAVEGVGEKVLPWLQLLNAGQQMTK